MHKQVAVVAVVVLVIAHAMGVAWADDGTPNLGTAKIGQVDSRWFAEERIWDSASGQNWTENSTFSIGFTSPINADLEFGLMYSNMQGNGKDALNGAVRFSRRDALSPAFKQRIGSAANATRAALTVGADMTVIHRGIGVNTQPNTGGGASTAWQDNFTPFAKLQVEWGQPGQLEFTVAAQFAWWDRWCRTNAVTNPTEGYGTVIGLGGGLLWSLSPRLSVSGDVLGVVHGNNTLSTGNQPDRSMVWSAGGAWAFGDESNTTVGVYATNAMGPTLATSVISAPDESVGVGVAVRRDF